MEITRSKQRQEILELQHALEACKSELYNLRRVKATVVQHKKGHSFLWYMLGVISGVILSLMLY